jgi:glycosyl transferase family 1
VEPVAFITEPLLSPEFVQFEVVVPLVQRLAKFGEVAIAAPSISRDTRQALEDRGIRAISAGASFPPLRHSRDEIPTYIWSWLRDAPFGRNRRALEGALREFGGLRVNYSMTTACRADCWYIQSGPLGPALRKMGSSIDPPIRTAFQLAAPTVGLVDLHHLSRIARHSRRMYSSTHHVGTWFRSRGIPIRGVLPVYFRPVFHPTTSNPTRDYALAYLGKETDTEALAGLCETGLPVQVFGSKSADWVRELFERRRYSNVHVLGRVSDPRLRELYTNALFTAFPFTEEPFGLVPLESMACGTPVLTYRRQGPAESVQDGRTGWLVDSASEFVARSRALFADGYPTSISANCLRRAGDYHLDETVKRWRSLLECIAAGAPDPTGIQPFAKDPGSSPFPYVAPPRRTVSVPALSPFYVDKLSGGRLGILDLLEHPGRSLTGQVVSPFAAESDPDMNGEHVPTPRMPEGRSGLFGEDF